MAKRSNDKWLKARMAKVQDEAKANQAAHQLKDALSILYRVGECPMVGLAGVKIVVGAQTREQEKDLRKLMKVAHDKFKDHDVEVKYLGKPKPAPTA